MAVKTPNGMEMPFELVTDHSCLCGEGPLWDDQHKRLYWIDIVRGEINCHLSDEKQLAHFETGQKIGAIGLTESGKLIAALKNGIYHIDFFNGTMTKISDPEPDKADNRFNDGKCDPAGRFWAGTMSDKGVPGSGSLYTLEKDGTVSKKLQKLSISNGLAWGLHAEKFYHVDTPTRKIVAYDYCNESGMISNGVPIIEIDETEGVPDGMTIDAEGMLWVAHWNGGRVSRWDPGTSRKLSEIFLPVSKVTSCAFGGENMEDLYVTTARVGLSPGEIIDQPLAGATFIFKQIGVQGVPNTLIKDSGFPMLKH